MATRRPGGRDWTLASNPCNARPPARQSTNEENRAAAYSRGEEWIRPRARNFESASSKQRGCGLWDDLLTG